GRDDHVTRRPQGRQGPPALVHRGRALDVRPVRVALEEIPQRGRIPAQDDAAGLFRLAQQRVEGGRVLAGEERFGPGDDNGVRGLELEGGTADEGSEALDRAGEHVHAAVGEGAGGAAYGGDGVDADVRGRRGRPRRR